MWQYLLATVAPSNAHQKRAPAKISNMGIMRASTPPSRASTMPVRMMTTRTLLGTACAAASQSAAASSVPHTRAGRGECAGGGKLCTPSASAAHAAGTPASRPTAGPSHQQAAPTGSANRQHPRTLANLCQVVAACCALLGKAACRAAAIVPDRRGRHKHGRPLALGRAADGALCWRPAHEAAASSGSTSGRARGVL